MAYRMTVAELIEQLQKLPDHNKPVSISVGTYTTRYPQAYVGPYEVSQCYEGATIHVSLPEGMWIGHRKQK